MLKVANLRLLVGTDEAYLTTATARRLRVAESHLGPIRILRKALDIRDKRRLEFVYTVGVSLPSSKEENRLQTRLRDQQVTHFTPVPYEVPQPGPALLAQRPVIVGAGPAGLFAAYQLAEQGYAPIVVERGQPVRQRIRDVKDFDNGGPFLPESNYLFGEGGAGTFSDGKLTCRSSGPDAERVLAIFAQCKGKPSVVYEAKPHLGSNRLPAVVKSLRQHVEQMGGEFRYGCQVQDLILQDGRVVGLQTNEGVLPATVAVLAIGHSARDTYAMLRRQGVALQPKPFQLGVRIEQPQANVTQAQFGHSPQAALLGPADYTMKVRAGDTDLFTFCMCAGGYVMPSVSEPTYFCTNGMSRAKHESPFANSGLVITIDPQHLPAGRLGDPFAGIDYQRQLEGAAYRIGGGDYRVPIQYARDFLRQTRSVGSIPSSYPRGIEPTNLWELMPAEVLQAVARGLPLMDNRWQGLFLKDATLVGPEARGSCPVRFLRHPQTLESLSTPGLYPIGEGAGFAGGIVSAAMDGLRVAKAIIQQFQPLAEPHADRRATTSRLFNSIS